MPNRISFTSFTIGFLFGILLIGLCFLLIPNKKPLTSSASRFEERIGQTPTPIIYQEPRVDINNATITDLVSLPGLGEAKSVAIIEFREKYGPFEDISELTYVPGIGTNLVNSIQDMVIINND